MNPIEWERWSDAETARNKALTGLKQTPFCVTTNTYLGELTAGNSKGGDPRNALSSSPRNPTHRADASFTCRALRAAPPPLAGVGSHRELDPQRLAAAGGVVDGGVHDLVDGVEQAGDILQEGWEVEVKWNLGLFFFFLNFIQERLFLEHHLIKKL